MAGPDRPFGCEHGAAGVEQVALELRYHGRHGQDASAGPAAIDCECDGGSALLDGERRSRHADGESRFRLRPGDDHGQPRQSDVSRHRGLQRLHSRDLERRDQLAAVRADGRADPRRDLAASGHDGHARERRDGHRVNCRDGLGRRRRGHFARHGVPEPGGGRAGWTSSVRAQSDLPRRRGVDRRRPSGRRGGQPDHAVELPRGLGLHDPDQHVAEPGQRRLYAARECLRSRWPLRCPRLAQHPRGQLDRDRAIRSNRHARPG